MTQLNNILLREQRYWSPNPNYIFYKQLGSQLLDMTGNSFAQKCVRKLTFCGNHSELCDVLLCNKPTYQPTSCPGFMHYNVNLT